MSHSTVMPANSTKSAKKAKGKGKEKDPRDTEMIIMGMPRAQERGKLKEKEAKGSMLCSISIW